MNTLQSFLLTLIAALLITGCGIFADDASDDKETFDPYEVGSFRVVSEDKAEYIGSSQNKFAKKFDTLDIYGPDDLSFHIVNDTSEFGKFDFVFIDSTINADSVGIYTLTDILYPDRIVGNPFGHGGTNTKANSDRYQATLQMGWDCNNDPDRVPEMYRIFFRVSDDSTNFHRVYNIHADGIVDATFAVGC